MDTGSDEPFLDEDAVNRIGETLGKRKVQSSHLLQLAAGLYLAVADQERSGTGRGTKADLKRTAKALGKAADALEALPLQSAMYASLAKTEAGVVETGFLGWQKRVGPELRRNQLLLEAWCSSRKKIVPDLDFPMMLALGSIAEVYQQTTGNAPTLSYHKDGEYLGRPVSEFGRFVAAFFKEVDPQRSETSIVTSIRNYLSEQRSSV